MDKAIQSIAGAAGILRLIAAGFAAGALGALVLSVAVMGFVLAG